MTFEKAEFMTSAPALENCPEPTLPEFCFAGRSNVGKSSLINKLTNSKKLARTSNTPGKTQQMNYYRINDAFFLVDLPGFGYAKVPEAERQRWGKNIKQYLLQRETLEMVLHLVDARHDPTALDEEFFFWMAANNRPFSVLLAKMDKISKNRMHQSVSRIHRILKEMNIEVPVIACSASTGSGINEIQALIHEFSKPESTK